MSTEKTDKELAFLHDLFVATDWGKDSPSWSTSTSNFLTKVARSM